MAQKTLIRIALTLVFLVPVMLVTVGCGQKSQQIGSASKESTQATKQEAKPIKLGAFLDLSMVIPDIGIPIANGMKLALKEINAAGGIDGRSLELKIEDDQLQPERAVNIANRFISVENVLAVVGGNGSGPTLAVAKVAEEKQVPHVNPTAIADSITDPPKKWTFSTAPRTSWDNRSILAELKKRGAKRIAILHDTGEANLQNKNISLKIAPELGVEIVTIQGYNFGVTDLTPQLLQIKNSNPDAIILWSVANDAALAMKTAKEQVGLTKQLYAGQRALNSADFLKLAGSVSEGLITIDNVNPNKQSLIELAKKYEAEYAKPMQGFPGPQGYETIKFISKVLKENPKARDDRAAFRDALEKASGYEAIQGKEGIKWSFTPDRHVAWEDPGDYAVMIELKGGKFVPMQ